MGRREARLAKDQQKKKKLQKIALIGGGAAIAAAATVGAFTLFGNGTQITEIENHVPADVDALFISEKNLDSWEYTKALSGSANSQQIDAATMVGAAFKDGKTYFYAAGEKKAMDTEMEKRGLADLPNLDGVYLLEGEADGLVEVGLGASEDYAGKDLKEAPSFGYVTNNNFDEDYFAGESGIPTKKWIWFGTFSEGAWVGDTSGVKASDFDLDKLDDWVNFEKKPAFLNDSFVQKDDAIGISLTLKELSTISGIPEYSSGIDDIKATLDNEGVMQISLERKQ